MRSIPLMIFVAFSMLVIAAHVAALDPSMVTRASTIMVFLPESSGDLQPKRNVVSISAVTRS
jgi:hypothetical protein